MTGPLSPDGVGTYLASNAVIDDASDAAVDQLGGGVSNTVLKVETDGRCVVVKQPLANLAVEDDWPASVVRIHNEAEATRVYGRILDDGDVRVPGVIHEDHDAHVLVLSCAPDTASTWKRELLGGSVDAAIARRVGTALARIHTATAGDEGLRSRFDDREPFEQLRLDPYHRTVAERHPDVSSHVRGELDRLADAERVLVHGDYSPKNVLVDRSATPPAVWLLDFEVAHWGDPAFDAAFLLNHLFIKSVYNDDGRAAYVEAAMAFWRVYDRLVEWDVERNTVRELAILMLARVDGKSPVEYLERESTAAALRTIAKRALRSDVETVTGFAGVVREASEER